MEHFITFLEPDLGTVEITQPHGFNALDLINGRTTYLEVRNDGGAGFGKLVASLTRSGAMADAYYIFREPCGNSVLLNICFSRAHTDRHTYFGMYVNDYSPAVFVKAHSLNGREQHWVTS